MKLFDELKRRQVLRVAAAYAVSAWLVIQIVTTVEEPLGLPDWVDTSVIIALGIGLPIALVLSWAFKVVPERPADDWPPEGSAEAPGTGPGRTIDRAIIVALLLALGYFVWDRIGGPVAPERSVENVEGELSLAVLPFVNLSGIAANEYFSDGITEEILNTIVQLGILDVIGRTSSFQFKGRSLDLRQVGEALNASHILEGSVRRVGNEVRITAQLVEARTGYQIWSGGYDRSLTDILQVQAEVAAAIAAELRLTLDAPGSHDALPVSGEAYDLYLRAKDRIAEQTFESINEGIRLLEEATELETEFAALWVARAQAYLQAGRIGIMDHVEAARRALILLRVAAAEGGEGMGQYYFVRGIAKRYIGDVDASDSDLRRAYELEPTDTDIAATYAEVISADRGGTLTAIDILQRAYRRDPLNYWTPFVIGRLYGHLMHVEEAERYMREAVEIAPDVPSAAAFYGIFQMRNGRMASGLETVIEGFRNDPDDPERHTFPGTAYLSLGDYERTRAEARLALALDRTTGHAAYLLAAADYLDPSVPGERPSAYRAAVRAELVELMSDPDTVIRRVQGLPQLLLAELHLTDGNPAAAVDAFAEHTPELPSLLAEDPPLGELEQWMTLGAYAQLLLLAGRAEEADRIGERLDWIDEAAASDVAGGALNQTALRLLIYSRTGFVADAQVLSWLQQVYEVGDFYDWRARYRLYPGFRLIGDAASLDALWGRFEAAMAEARRQGGDRFGG
jgi:TolB-like protein